MSRRRYPSDDARKRQRPHVKVHLTIANHPTYGHVFADPLLRGVILGIWVVAARAHISATNDELTMTAGDALWITGTQRMVDAAKVLQRACDVMKYKLRRSCDLHADCRAIGRRTAGDPSANGRRSVGESSMNDRRRSCERPARWVVHVRNFARKQGFTPQAPAETPHDSKLSEVPKNQRTDIPHSATPPTTQEPPSDDGFEQAWKLYPKRAGGNSKKNAYAKWNSRIRNGVDPAELIAGVERYSKYIRATGKEGTEYVQQTATFFGPSEHWKEPWDIPDRMNQENGGFVV